MNCITNRTAFDRVSFGTRKPLAATLMGLLLLATWSLLHRYKGLTQDGELYAFQAIARLNPALRSDVYLMANSQDEFTIFSPLYAVLIRCLGLWSASVALFASCVIAFMTAAWACARNLWDEERAWLAVASCIVVVCGYGAYGVFTYSENYLTARSMAEGMVIIALACHLNGLYKWSWAIVAASILIHPLMALPGLLLLVCLSVPLSVAALGALAGVMTVFLMAWLALHIDHGPHILSTISGEWLEVVRERSQYLFLQQWRLPDWEEHARPILCLSIAALVAEQPRVRALCIGGILVGSAGLVVALIASNVGPVAILLQGQAWRWFWVTGFVAVLALAPTALRLWNVGGCGAVCATLLVASWTFPPANGSYLAAAALGLWSVRQQLKPNSQKLSQYLAYAMIAAILAWNIGNIWSLCRSRPVDLVGEPLIIERLRSVYALQIPAFVVFGLTWAWLRSGMNIYASAAAALLLITLCSFAVQGSFNRHSTINGGAGIEALPDWRAAIPPTDNVLVVPSGKAAGFIWFTLQRPSYLTVDQSAGVVFSEKTALEIRRRSEVLLPIMEPDWKISTQLARSGKEREKARNEKDEAHSLTADKLLAICRDPALGFVIARERLGFDENTSKDPGLWKNWNLYDCRLVRRRASS